jgi:hypothetical protein
MAELKALLENRKEHLQYLQDVLVEPVLQEFQDMYTVATKKSKVLQEFQDEVGKIPEWNHVMISNSFERIQKRSGCNFIPELVRIHQAARADDREIHAQGDDLVCQKHLEATLSVLPRRAQHRTSIQPLEDRRDHQETD